MSSTEMLVHQREERVQKGMQLLEIRATLDTQREENENAYHEIQKEMDIVIDNLERLQGQLERTEEQEEELERYQERREELDERRSRIQQELDHIEVMFQCLPPGSWEDNTPRLDSVLMLNVLDNDSENELYSVGAREYARRLAERMRAGEFDKN